MQVRLKKIVLSLALFYQKCKKKYFQNVQLLLRAQVHYCSRIIINLMNIICRVGDALSDAMQIAAMYQYVHLVEFSGGILEVCSQTKQSYWVNIINRLKKFKKC